MSQIFNTIILNCVFTTMSLNISQTICAKTRSLPAVGLLVFLRTQVSFLQIRVYSNFRILVNYVFKVAFQNSKQCRPCSEYQGCIWSPLLEFVFELTWQYCQGVLLACIMWITLLSWISMCKICTNLFIVDTRTKSFYSLSVHHVIFCVSKQKKHEFVLDEISNTVGALFFCCCFTSLKSHFHDVPLGNVHCLMLFIWH